MKTIINVANRLPITVGKTIQKSSGGLVSALEGVSRNRYQLKWLGWPGKTYTQEKRKSEVEDILVNEFDYVPVFLTKGEVANYYQGFSNSSLWPILHYMSNYMHYDEEHWKEYENVNHRFADRVLEIADEKDTIWIHDYHLMLLPSILREREPKLRTGFFLHTPFPSSEVFRCHPRRTELIRGLLGADLIGFHTFGYLRHFRSTVLRLLGLESEMSSITDARHETALGVYPIGINSEKFKQTLESDEFRERKEEFRHNWKGKRLILSVERLDYTKGILHRLDAVDEFLAKYPNIRDVNFVFVAVPSREEVKEYQELRENVEHQVGKINGRYATVEFSPIHFIYKGVPFTDLCALYSLADVALVTPLVDGMNLVAKEFVACQSDDDPGVLILSEFAGAAQELVNALSVNPYHVEQVADALKRALDMGRAERLRRLKYMRPRVIKYDANFWAQSYLDDLMSQEVKTEQPIEYEHAETRILAAFSGAKRPAFVLNYDGTMRELEDEPQKAAPSRELLDLLAELEQRKDIDVFVISGRKQADLQQWLGDYRFGIIAEHGSSFRRDKDSPWEKTDVKADLDWKRRLLPILRHYEGSTPGSFVEEKASSIVWHYRQSDPEFGQWKANQLMSDVYEMLANLAVETHHGKKIVEISSIEINKGVALESILKDAEYDFVLCAGDDQTDETMFRLDQDGLITVKVGEGDTHAHYRIRSPREFRRLLGRILNA